MPVDGALGEVERVGHLLVGATRGDERRHPLFCGSEVAGRGCPAADALELGAGSLRPERRADSLEELDRGLERLPSLAPSVRAALRRPERDAASARGRAEGLRERATRAPRRTRPAPPRHGRPATASSPRHRRQAAIADARSSRRAFPSYQSRSSTASSRRPSSTSASTWSTTNRIAAGSAMLLRSCASDSRARGRPPAFRRSRAPARDVRAHPSRELRAGLSVPSPVDEREPERGRPGRVPLAAVRLDYGPRAPG